MDTNGQEYSVHDLTEEELDDLVRELFREQDHDDEPCDYVDGVSDDEMTKENVSHHENQWERQLDLKLIETSNCPLSKVFCLIWK